MGHPLDIVNKVIYDNILLPAKLNAFEKLSSASQEELASVAKLYDSHVLDSKWTERIEEDAYCYPEDFLEECLKVLRPIKDRKLKKNWNEKSLVIVESYLDYADLFNNPAGRDIWVKFARELFEGFRA
jgi:hypothetical protein